MKMHVFTKKICRIFCQFKKSSYLCNRKREKTTYFFHELFVSFKKVPTFASAIEKQTLIRESKKQKCNNRMARSSIG